MHGGQQTRMTHEHLLNNLGWSVRGMAFELTQGFATNRECAWSASGACLRALGQMLRGNLMHRAKP